MNNNRKMKIACTQANMNGRKAFKELRNGHTLIASSFALMGAGISKKGLEIVRLTSDKRIADKLRKMFKHDMAQRCDKVLSLYQKSQVSYKKTIWCLWLQGEDSAPNIVKRCLESIRENMSDWQVNVLDEQSIHDYIFLPSYIEEKYKRGIICPAHYSDLIRLELLCTYGGIWLDATVLLTGPIPDYICDANLFMYQTLKPGLDGHSTAVSNWLITAHAPSCVLLLTRELLLEYWRSCNGPVINYYLFHHFVQIAIELFPREWSAVAPCSNELPHVLLLRLSEPFNQYVYDAVCEQTAVHKMTYKLERIDTVSLSTFYRKMFVANS